MALAGLSEGIYALPCQRRNLHHGIARTFIDLVECLKHFLMRLAVKVDLVQDDGYRHIIHLACHEDTVEERQLDLGIIDGCDDERTVKVGRYDMGLAGKVGGLADDVVPARFHRSDDSGILRSNKGREFLLRSTIRHLCLEIHDIAHSHRVCSRASLEPYLSSEHCREKIPLRQL